MFFFITHILVNNVCSNFVTHFIIGCTCYIVLFALINRCSEWKFLRTYRYFFLVLFTIDLWFIATHIKNKFASNKNIHHKVETDIPVRSSTIDTEQFSISLHSSTLSSEINDYHITHEIDVGTDTDTMYSMFSNSDKAQEDNKN